MKIFIIGGPGSGKNVIGQHLAAKLKITHINYRSLVLKQAARGNKGATELVSTNKGKPFSPKKAYQILSEYLEENQINDFVMDGYPKSKDEARLLSSYFSSHKKDNLTFLINTSKKIITERLKNRLVCPQCSYLLYESNPDSILEIKCANCHLPLIRRRDDNDKGIKTRITRFLKEQPGIIEELSKFTTTQVINGSNGIASVTSDIIEAIFGRTKDTLAERGARILIEQLGLNLADPNIVGTPTRLVKTLSELMRGQNKEAQFSIKECLSTAFPTHYKGMVILEPIKCISLCSHHLLPISYEVIFGYIPKDKSLGFSKIIKVINLLAAKPTLQEDFTQEIIDTFNNVLDPKGIMIIVKGKHECMIIRGEKSDNSNITSAIRGVFKDEEKTRKEFLSLVNLGNKSYM